MSQAETDEPILLLDDEFFILKFLQSTLEAEGYRNIRQATSGEMAKEALERERFRIFISDVFLPDGDGRDLAQRYLELNPEGRAVLMTGFSPEELELPEALRGRVSLLEKPFTGEKLLAILAPEPTKEGVKGAALQLRSSPQIHLSAVVS